MCLCCLVDVYSWFTFCSISKEVHSGRYLLVYHISKRHPSMHGYVIHKEPQILLLDVHLPFSKTIIQDMPHFLTTHTNSKGQPLPLHMNLHTDIMLPYHVLCSYFPGITKWESHEEKWHLNGGIQQENRNPPGFRPISTHTTQVKL